MFSFVLSYFTVRFYWLFTRGQKLCHSDVMHYIHIMIAKFVATYTSLFIGEYMIFYISIFPMALTIIIASAYPTRNDVSHLDRVHGPHFMSDDYKGP